MVYFIAEIFFKEEKKLDSYWEYVEKVKPIVSRYQGKYIVRSDHISTVNRDGERKPDRVIVIAFDSRKQLDLCFSSQEYRSISFLRENAVESRARIVE